MPSTPHPSEAATSNGVSTTASKPYLDLLLACRTGDADTVDSLTLNSELDINQVDEWDYLPLILALICGHLKVVELLLARGAICDRDTFQGERCIYGALTNEIKTLLISYDITKTVDEKQPFLAHVSQLVTPAFSLLAARDIALRTADTVFVVNRFLLAARSPYFAAKMAGAWRRRSVVDMPESTDTLAVQAVVDYIYLRPSTLVLPQISAFARKLSLAGLRDTDGGDKQHLRNVADSKDDMRQFLRDHVVANAYRYEVTEEIDFEDIEPKSLLSADAKDTLLQCSAYPDAILSFIDVEDGSVMFYPVHRAMLARSDFYALMFRLRLFHAVKNNLPYAEVFGPHGERVVDRPLLRLDHVPVLQPLLSSTDRHVMEAVLQYLYYDDVTHIPVDLGVELLYVSEELHIDRLKTMSALVLTSVVQDFDYASLDRLVAATGYSAVELVEVAWDIRNERLEQHMTKLLAYNVEQVCDSPLLRAELMLLIRKSAWRIMRRHNTDTIELVDDMRYYLAKKYAVYDDFAGLEGVGRSLNPTVAEPEDNRWLVAAMVNHDHDIALIDGLLEDLGLDA